jgi:hypothetical protein
MCFETENAKPIRARKPTAKEQAKDAIAIASTRFEGRDKLLLECKAHSDRRGTYYGVPEKEQVCGLCKKPRDACDSHALPRSADTTDDKAELLWRLAMQDIIAYVKSLKLDDVEDRVAKAKDYAEFRVIDDDDEGDGSLKAEKDETDVAKYSRYVIGVLMAVGLDGVVYYGACAGQPRAPVTAALKQMLNDHGADKNEYIGDATLQRTGLRRKKRDQEGFDNLTGKPTILTLERRDNTPGACAAAQLLQRCMAEDTVPLCMTEIFVEPADVEALIRGNKELQNMKPKPAASCNTCLDNLPQVLCGLSIARSNFAKDLTDKAIYADDLAESEKALQKSVVQQQAREKSEVDKLLQKWFVIDNEKSICEYHRSNPDSSSSPDLDAAVDYCGDDEDIVCKFREDTKDFDKFREEQRGTGEKALIGAPSLKQDYLLITGKGASDRKAAFRKKHAEDIALYKKLGLCDKADFL